MTKPTLLHCLAAALLAAAPLGAHAQETLKIGLILPMTGPFASTGRQVEAAARLYLAQNGATVAGKKVELVLRDDAGTADTTRRIAQELVVNDKVVALAGFGLTPLALATAPIATQSKTPMVVMAAATSSIIKASPYIVRTSFTLPQVTLGIAEWAAKNGMKKVVTLVSDYGPGIDAEKTFTSRFTLSGGTVPAELRVPLRNPDFAPFLQRVIDAKPDGLFVFLPSGVGTQFMKQFTERGLDKSGIRLIATGDVTDDDILNDMGDVALGVATSHPLLRLAQVAAQPEVRRRVRARPTTACARTSWRSGGYDGMRVIMKGLEATKGKGGEALLDAMKGQVFESPRGQILIDAQTRDIVQDVYIRKVERVDGQLYNMEFDKQTAVRDPAPK